MVEVGRQFRSVLTILKYLATPLFAYVDKIAEVYIPSLWGGASKRQVRFPLRGTPPKFGGSPLFYHKSFPNLGGTPPFIFSVEEYPFYT